MRTCTLLALALAVALVAPAAAGAAKPKKQFYVSLGDSYAVGYQATGPDSGKPTAKGYANQLVRKARKRGHRYELVNFGCGGETTTSILRRKAACDGPAVGGPRYAGRTQIAAAERFLRRHRGEVGLITVAIGGNDVTACAREADPVPCVAAAAESIEDNLATLTERLREAAGRKVRIVGITYPDVILGGWVSGVPADQDLARLSVIAFQQIINPALRKAYRAAGGRFVDVTAASGSYTPLEQTTTLAPYGTVPVAVAEICRLTYYCEFRDIHARSNGYGLIADLIAKTLPRRG